ncbi:hypothetical protein B0H67DRAFT_657031 [Lasiosphaeris hirsuta]|uniref:Uncharacterized protein n=1 Tax=Lasiosphaeris hirsuta TaxID=260670 RepID=A0AA40AYS7_9PEZI|nr:hypothetical protein B0H67DRAFT_657031 [Lasiosphaeris hirsuta]
MLLQTSGHTLPLRQGSVLSLGYCLLAPLDPCPPSRSESIGNGRTRFSFVRHHDCRPGHVGTFVAVVLADGRWLASGHRIPPAPNLEFPDFDFETDDQGDLMLDFSTDLAEFGPLGPSGPSTLPYPTPVFDHLSYPTPVTDPAQTTLPYSFATQGTPWQADGSFDDQPSSASPHNNLMHPAAQHWDHQPDTAFRAPLSEDLSLPFELPLTGDGFAPLL